MVEVEVSKQVRSFVSFALAIKPSVTLQRHCVNEPLSHTAVEFKLSDTVKLSEPELSSLESLIKKYEPIKDYLHISTSPEDQSGFNIATCSPTVKFQPDVNYQILDLNSEQLDIAKEVATRVDHTYRSHTAGDHASARLAYDELQDYLKGHRTAMIGDFKNLNAVNEAVGLHGVGRNGNPVADGDCGGAVIFVIIEIFIC